MKYKNKIVLSFVTSLILSNSVYAKDTNQLDTLTVTAQKTEENIQDVPISMSVFDEFTLEDRNIDEVIDIAKYTPGLDIIGYSTLKYSPSIRGMFADHSNFSSVAGLYIDGIPNTSGMGFDASLMDIERVEVLKGPQGTLYGKNTEVGVINVITKKPNNETKGKIKATIGTDDKRELAFLASGPILKDKFYIGIAGKHYEKDGFIKNTYKNKIENDSEHDYAKINLRWTPTDNLEASFISSKIKYNNGATKINNSTNKDREIPSDFDTYNKSEVILNALNINYTINDKLSLSSTTTYSKDKVINANDWDFGSDYSQRMHSAENAIYKTLAEEVKLNYENDNIKLVSGLFVETRDIHIEGTNDHYWKSSISTNIEDMKTDSIGLFSHLTYDINEKLSVLGGLRYDKTEQEYKDSTETIENSENEISPKIGLTYDLKENMMSYATISKGYRAGGFNTKTPVGKPKTYDKETLYSYEVGLKGFALDNRLSYDIAVYYMDITDMQASVYFPSGDKIFANAAEATSKGVEASLNFQATNSLNLFAGFSYNHIKFDKYHDGTSDLSGNRTEFSPKYDFNLGAVYRADNGYYASADISGYGDMYLDSANKNKRDAYELVNAKIGYETDDFDIYLYGKNLFDKKYDSDGVYGYYTTYSEPREIGIQLAYRF